MIYKNKYVSLLSDSGFKAVYADPQNKSLLIDLLNELLPPPASVDDIVEYCDREQLAETVDSKRPAKPKVEHLELKVHWCEEF